MAPIRTNPTQQHIILCRVCFNAHGPLGMIVHVGLSPGEHEEGRLPDREHEDRRQIIILIMIIMIIVLLLVVLL